MKSVALFHQRWPHSTRDSEAQSAHDRLHAPYRGLMIKVCNITETVAKEIEQERYPPTPVASQLTATSVEEMPISSHLFSIVAGGKKQLFQPPQARVWYIYMAKGKLEKSSASFFCSQLAQRHGTGAYSYNRSRSMPRLGKFWLPRTWKPTAGEVEYRRPDYNYSGELLEAGISVFTAELNRPRFGTQYPARFGSRRTIFTPVTPATTPQVSAPLRKLTHSVYNTRLYRHLMHKPAHAHLGTALLSTWNNRIDLNTCV